MHPEPEAPQRDPLIGNSQRELSSAVADLLQKCKWKDEKQHVCYCLPLYLSYIFSLWICILIHVPWGPWLWSSARLWGAKEGRSSVGHPESYRERQKVSSKHKLRHIYSCSSAWPVKHPLVFFFFFLRDSSYANIAGAQFHTSIHISGAKLTDTLTS